MKVIIKSDYFLTGLLLTDIPSDYKVIDIKKLIDVKERKKRGFFHRLMKYKIIPFIRLFYGCIVNNPPLNNNKVVYFGIDRIDLLAKLVLINNGFSNQVLWLWNPIKSISKFTIATRFFLFLIKRNNVKVWTFDINDARKYGLNYHAQIYSAKINKKDNNNDIHYDIIFIGQDKGRLPILREIKEKFESMGLRVFMHVVRDSDVKYDDDDDDGFLLQSTPMEYLDYIDCVLKSNCILDINQTGQYGLTLRVLESLFLEKKLITNNYDVLNYDFYNKKNIMLLSSELMLEPCVTMSFIHDEYDLSASSYKKNYDVENLLLELFR